MMLRFGPEFACAPAVKLSAPHGTRTVPRMAPAYGCVPAEPAPIPALYAFIADIRSAQSLGATRYSLPFRDGPIAAAILQIVRVAASSRRPIVLDAGGHAVSDAALDSALWHATGCPCSLLQS
jgi:hypothetical protein